MILTLSNQDSNGTQYAARIGNFARWTRIRIQVFGANTVYIADNRQQLVSPATGGNQQGLQLAAAGGIYLDWWKGELWASASAAGTICEFQATEGNEPILPSSGG